MKCEFQKPEESAAMGARLRRLKQEYQYSEGESKPTRSRGCGRGMRTGYRAKIHVGLRLGSHRSKSLAVASTSIRRPLIQSESNRNVILNRIARLT